jgi:hypothetical protein
MRSNSPNLNTSHELCGATVPAMTLASLRGPLVRLDEIYGQKPGKAPRRAVSCFTAAVPQRRNRELGELLQRRGPFSNSTGPSTRDRQDGQPALAFFESGGACHARGSPSQSGACAFAPGSGARKLVTDGSPSRLGSGQIRTVIASSQTPSNSQTATRLAGFKVALSLLCTRSLERRDGV